jgi:glycosyltransferase involved in cell wall biosynthesis
VLRPEWAVLAAWFLDGQYLKRTLRSALRKYAGRRVIVYAQDPTSVKVATDLRQGGYAFRLTATAHFNVSEGYEQVLAGNARPRGPLVRFLERTERHGLPAVDALAFPSARMRGVFLERYPEFPAARALVISNFPASPRPPTRPGPEGDVISIGTLEPRKNQGFLIQAIAEAKRLGFSYRLTLVGRGPSESSLRKLAAALGVKDLVHFAGRIDDAAPLIASHRLYAHGARFESQGITLLEALSYGRPVLAAPVGGIPEVFDDGVEGYYVDLDDPVSAATRMIQILESPDTYGRMSMSALERYRRCYAVEVVAPKWSAFLLGSQDFDHSGQPCPARDRLPEIAEPHSVPSDSSVGGAA